MSCLRYHANRGSSGDTIGSLLIFDGGGVEGPGALCLSSRRGEGIEYAVPGTLSGEGIEYAVPGTLSCPRNPVGNLSWLYRLAKGGQGDAHKIVLAEEHEHRLYRDAHSFYPRPHALRGDASPHALRELRRGRLQPVDDHRNERRQRCIIPRARISPVNAIVHVPAPHRVVVNVLQLLPHHGLVGDHPRMASLLPELMISVRPAGDEVGILGVTKLVATSAHGELFGHA
jgi:hypothetical protein